MIAHRALLTALLLAAGEPARVKIPDELFLQLATAPPRSCADAAAEQEAAAGERRAEAAAKVAFADAVDLTGHIERREGELLTVVGRRVDTETAEIAGGGRDSLRPGALVRVLGTGLPDGRVRADRIEIVPPRDPDVAARLGREVEKFKTKYWRKAKRLDDPALVAYLDGIVRRLAPGYVPEADRRFEIAVVQDPDLNAFALPDGTIVVHTGLLARMESEAQLASVLAHEMAHVTERHSLRAMGKATEHAILNWGSLLAAVALGAAGKADAGQGIQLMSSAWLSAYSRDHEDEADQVGLRYLYLAGYDVREAPRVWQTFQLLYGDPTREANFFYGSHSTGRDREHNLSHELWKAYEPSGLVGGRVGREEFLARTAPAVRANAVLDLERGNLAWAEWGLQKSLAAAPDDAETYVAVGRLARRSGGRGGLEEAVDAFRHAVALDPANPRAHRELGYALRALGDSKGARAAFERYLALEPETADARSVRRVLESI